MILKRSRGNGCEIKGSEGLEVWMFDYMLLKRPECASAPRSSGAFSSRNHWSSLKVLISLLEGFTYHFDKVLKSLWMKASFNWRSLKSGKLDLEWKRNIWDVRKIRKCFPVARSMLSTVGARNSGEILASSNNCHQKIFSSLFFIQGATYHHSFMIQRVSQELSNVCDT
jgi:hypothetical protein